MKIPYIILKMTFQSSGGKSVSDEAICGDDLSTTWGKQVVQLLLLINIWPS